MKYLLFSFILAALVSCGSSNQKASLKWVQLFNGKDLNDWRIKIKDHELNENFGNTFRVENGVMKVSYDQYDGFKEKWK